MDSCCIEERSNPIKYTIIIGQHIYVRRRVYVCIYDDDLCVCVCVRSQQ